MRQLSRNNEDDRRPFDHGDPGALVTARAQLKRTLVCILVLLAPIGAAAQTRPAVPLVTLSRDRQLGPMAIDHVALGQGGLSADPMFHWRVAEIRALHPALIRLFVQEYYDVLPRRGRPDFKTLDRSVDDIIQAGSSPLMCLCFKPRLLFPIVDQRQVEPSNYDAWEKLVFKLVRHYSRRHPGRVRYWEIGNEVDIGESGGCPYLFQPDSYVRYYRRTAAAILRADPDARVGGPALASVRSPILPALLAACDREKIPLHFVSWHVYSSSPTAIRNTIEYAGSLLKEHPGLKAETILDEWNMDLSDPPTNPAFQPCFVLETAWQMKEAGLDWSCYYHIRDYHVDEREFAPFFSPDGAAFMARWWNRMPQADGLFDFQDHVRPAYFAFKLLSRLTGQRLRLDAGGSGLHGLATYDSHYHVYSLLTWNFSQQPVEFELAVDGLPGPMLMRQIKLDAAAPSDDENARLHPQSPVRTSVPAPHQHVRLEPFGVQFWSFE